MDSPAAPGIGYLVMVLQEGDELVRMQPERGSAAKLLVPRGPLPLEEESPFHCGNELLRRPFKIAIIGLVPPGQRHARAMVKIVIPQSIQSITQYL